MPKLFDKSETKKNIEAARLRHSSMQAAKEMAVHYHPGLKMNCDQLGNELRSFMMWGFTNNQLAHMDFSEIANAATISGNWDTELEYARIMYDAFKSKGCGTDNEIKDETEETAQPRMK